MNRRTNCIARSAATLSTIALGAAAHGQAGPPPPPSPTPDVVREAPAAPREMETSITAGVTTYRIPAAGGVMLRVHAFGEGEPVLMLAGGPGFASRQLYSTAQEVAQTRRVLLLDQRGTGGSTVDDFAATDDSGATYFTIDAAVADLETVRTALGLERWSLVGHSWGALLSMAYASAHADRVERLALVSPAGADSSFWRTYEMNLGDRMTDDIRATVGRLAPTDHSPDAMAAFIREYNRAIAPTMVTNPDAVDTLRTLMDEDGFEPRVQMATQPYMGRYDLSEGLSNVQSPTLVVRGDDDPIGPEAVDRIIELLPNARGETIADCGHWPFLERPDALNALLAGFFAD